MCFSSVAYFDFSHQHSTFRMIALIVIFFYVFSMWECKMQLIKTTSIPRKHYTIVCRLQETVIIVIKSFFWKTQTVYFWQNKTSVKQVMWTTEICTVLRKQPLGQTTCCTITGQYWSPGYPPGKFSSFTRLGDSEKNKTCGWRLWWVQVQCFRTPASSRPSCCLAAAEWCALLNLKTAVSLLINTENLQERL